jgi:hypothetical protein
MVEVARDIQRQFEDVTKARLEIVEERRKMEVAAAKREAESQIAAVKAEAQNLARIERERADRLEREMAEVRNRLSTPAAPPQQDRLAEVLLEMKRSEQEQRKSEREFQAEQRRIEREHALEREKIQAEAKAESERLRMEMQRANNEMQAKLLQVATEKPSGSEMAEKVLMSVTGAISGLMSNQVNMINAMNELGMGGGGEEPEPEPRWLKSVERMVRAFGAMNRQPQGQQQPLPPPQQQPQQLPPPRQQQAPAQPLPPQQGPEQPLQQGPVSQEVVEQLTSAITNKTHDPGTIAEFILANLKDAGLQQLLISEQKMSRIFENLLGEEWLDDDNNVAFVKAVAQSFVEKGVAANLFDAADMKETLADIDTLGD